MWKWLPRAWREGIIRHIFSSLYDSYDYPFVKSDQLIAAMLPEEKIRFYDKVRDLVANPAYRQELQEAIRHFYQELAINKSTPEHGLMMQGALLFIKNFDVRLVHLSQMGLPPVEAGLIKDNL